MRVWTQHMRQIRESPFPGLKKWPIKNVDLQYVGLFSRILIIINAFTLSGWWRCEVPYSKPAAGPAAQRNLGSFSFSWCGLSQILWRETHDSPHHQPVLVQQRETRTPASEPTERQQREEISMPVIALRSFVFSENTAECCISDEIRNTAGNVSSTGIMVQHGGKVSIVTHSLRWWN